MSDDVRVRKTKNISQAKKFSEMIEGVLSKINEYTDTERIVVIKSTIIPGSTDEFNKKYKNNRHCI